MSAERNVERRAGLFGSVRRLIDSVLGLAQTRLELLSLDIAEERSRIVRIVIVVMAVLICLQGGILLSVIFLVLVLPEGSRAAAVGITAFVLLALAIGGAIWLRRWLKSQPAFFDATISEFRKDRERLGGEK